MKVSELYDLTHWTDKDLEDIREAHHYRVLQGMFEQYTPNHEYLPMEAHNGVSSDKNQLTFFEHLEMAEAIDGRGEEGWFYAV